MGRGVSKTAKKIPTCFMEGPLLIQYDVGIQTKSFGFDFQYDCKFSLSLCILKCAWAHTCAINTPVSAALMWTPWVDTAYVARSQLEDILATLM